MKEEVEVDEKVTEVENLPPPYEDEEKSLPLYVHCSAFRSATVRETISPYIKREFWLLNEKVFISEDSRFKYKDFKTSNARRNLKDYTTTLSYQRRGFGIPLLKADHHANFLSKKYLTVYKYSIPPKDQVRIFDKKVDRFVFCEIQEFNNVLTKHFTYNMSFTPDPDDTTKDFQLKMVVDNQRGIADISPYKGHRLRWVSQTKIKKNMLFQFSLYRLGLKQASLIDESSTISKTNNLQSLSYMEPLPTEYNSPADYVGSIELGNLYCEQKKSLFSEFVAKLEYEEASESTRMHPESIRSVSEEVLVYLTLACLCKTVQNFSAPIK